MGIESGPRPGVSSTNQAEYDTYPYCGDTRRTSVEETDDGLLIVNVENLDNPDDHESTEVVYPEDLPA